MSERVLLYGQPYPTLPGWEDLSAYLAKGWAIGNDHDFLRGRLEPNTAHISGRLRIGDERRATTQLPDVYLPVGGVTVTSPSASVRGVGAADIEVWSSGVVVLPHNSIAPGSRADQYTGEIFIFTISYPRRAT